MGLISLISDSRLLFYFNCRSNPVPTCLSYAKLPKSSFNKEYPSLHHWAFFVRSITAFDETLDLVEYLGCGTRGFSANKSQSTTTEHTQGLLATLVSGLL